MTKKKGSCVYVLNMKNGESFTEHKGTLNEAKEIGLRCFYEEDRPFYRFTKIPFPHLYYVSEDYIVYVTYARLADKDIPYIAKLSEYDKEVIRTFTLFEEEFNKSFYYNPDSRTKSRDLTKKKANRIKNSRTQTKNKIKHFDAYT